MCAGETSSSIGARVHVCNKNELSHHVLLIGVKGVSDLDLGPLAISFLSSDTTPVSSGVPTQSIHLL